MFERESNWAQSKVDFETECMSEVVSNATCTYIEIQYVSKR